MKSSRFALFAFAVIVVIGSIAGSAQYSSAAAGRFGPDYGWIENESTWTVSNVGAHGPDYPGRDKNIRACQKEYLPGGR